MSCQEDMVVWVFAEMKRNFNEDYEYIPLLCNAVPPLPY